MIQKCNGALHFCRSRTIFYRWARDLMMKSASISIIYKIGKYKEKRTKGVDTSRMGVN